LHAMFTLIFTYTNTHDPRYENDVEDAGAVAFYQSHLYSVSTTYIAFQVATIYAVVWCGGQAGSEVEVLPGSVRPTCAVATV
jgi:hypothetical protein